MPNRILRADILTSDRVARLSWAAECFYRRLMSVVDDYGRFDGRLAVLRTYLYPIQIDKVAERDVGKWRLEAVEAGLVTLYVAEGKEFIQIERFGQQIRSKSKFPDPPASATQVRATDEQVPASAHLVVSVSGGAVGDVSGGVADSQSPPPQATGSVAEMSERFDEFYAAYPRKLGRDVAFKAYAKAVRRLQFERSESIAEVAAYLLERASAFAKSPAGGRGQYTAHPSTWLNQGRYLDDDAEWNRSDNARGIVAAGDGQVAAGDSVGW